MEIEIASRLGDPTQSGTLFFGQSDCPKNRQSPNSVFVNH